MLGRSSWEGVVGEPWAVSRRAAKTLLSFLNSSGSLGN